MKRRFFVAAIVVVLLAGIAHAQDYIFTTFSWGHVDHALPPAPAGCEVQGAVQPMVFDHSAWMVYTCASGQVVARRFHHPVDRLREPVPVYDVNGLPPAPPTPQPIGCPAGFVAAVYGGCVPPDHPSATR